MRLPWFGRVGLAAGLALVLEWPGITLAEGWTAAAGDMGRDESRIAVQIGGSWGAVGGTEVEKVDPARGFEVGASYRVFRSASVYGSYASSTASVSGQLTQLLDQRIRPDGNSGNVDGEISFRRFRAGLRVDGLRQEDWPIQVYFIGAAVFSTNEVRIDSVDQAPPQPVAKAGGGVVDPSKFEDTQTGFLGRVGVEYRVMPRVGVDLGFTYEIFEPPPGTNSTTSLNGGVTIRI